jgi:hypothetical protein
MDISVFNELSSRIAKLPGLKQKIILQAYYYRISADLEDNTRKAMPILPAISEHNKERQKNLLKMPELVTSTKDYSAEGGKSSSKGKDDHKINTADTLYSTFAKPSHNDSKFDSFCKVLKNVELVRVRMRDHVQVLSFSHRYHYYFYDYYFERPLLSLELSCTRIIITNE